MTQKDEKAANVGEGSRLTDPDTAHERNKAMPESKDVVDPAEVWKNAETMPSEPATRKSGGDRVADAGDVGDGTASPYSEEAQADAVARQTCRPKTER